ncbi:hypothetical protein [Pleionea sp. CnH1-48]|uniref:hypothetical protein n=1 Tax=Pleionea sp. CnH1-48 TaxID=2954494 RepID=UPI0020975FB5|nr:hypothetical protein [Pleionea sp. CnH1-48]
MGVPVLMSDLTNIIRHGDLCALAAEEPLLIEMKSSNNRNARTARQFEQLEVLSKFFTNDDVGNFRGAVNTKRISLEREEVCYVAEINECIRQAIQLGFFTVSPEKGLKYIALTSEWYSSNVDSFNKKVNSITSKTCMMVTLTPEPSYLPLYPFTLSLTPLNTLLFIQEEIQLLVVIDIAVIKNHFNELGLHPIALMDGDHSFQLSLDPSDLMKGTFRVSELSFLRIACEFQSPKWFASEQYSLIKRVCSENTSESIDLNSEGLLTSPPLGWSEARDCLEDE